jgi:hypothetical protein
MYLTTHAVGSLDNGALDLCVIGPELDGDSEAAQHTLDTALRTRPESKPHTGQPSVE